jgi:hypothetical protein
VRSGPGFRPSCSSVGWCKFSKITLFRSAVTQRDAFLWGDARERCLSRGHVCAQSRPGAIKYECLRAYSENHTLKTPGDPLKHCKGWRASVRFHTTLKPL